MISEALREEVAGSDVRVCSLNPGVCETELLSHNPKEITDPYNKWKNELGKVLDSKDVSESIMFVYSMPKHACIRELTIAPTRQKQ